LTITDQLINAGAGLNRYGVHGTAHLTIAVAINEIVSNLLLMERDPKVNIRDTEKRTI